MRRALALAAAVALLVALVPAACAPPGDGPRDPVSVEASPAAGEAAPSEAPGGTAQRTAPRVASPAAVPREIVLQGLRGGTFVPRCPECGETQPDGSTTCGGCGQELAPWRQETVCPRCEGTGSCARCGDDRPCLACETSGRCPECDGSGDAAGARCDACRGRGVCRDCRGDGLRSSVLSDFAPHESHLPGICGACVDGSGACAACGGAGDDCAACGGSGECAECRGDGACVWDRGDGLCAACGGGGREVRNGPAATPADRTWTVRREDGSLLEGDVEGAPSPDLTVLVEKGGRRSPLLLVPSKVHPVSYYLAARDFTPLDDVDGRVRLATIAVERGFAALAVRELRRAQYLDPGRADRLRKRLREAEVLRARRWMERAREAENLGDREGAARLYAMVPRSSPEDAPAVRVALDALREALRVEREGLDDAARDRARRALAERVTRTVARTGRLLERAEARLALAREPGVDAARARLAWAAADDAARRAELLVGSDARRAPPSEIEWPRGPAELLAEARGMRASIAREQAVAEVAAGRFALGRRLALVAARLAGDDTAVLDVLAEAERGMMRQGVRVATPPPERER